ncbi:hypothetical protein ACFVSN_14415 [Kitasatospora sp. NPDC057904]|uniref:hypothetical protein n=1 Tax=Kitasatospora sp. NPDC057904 TaxID=3346275 RepID=UPI0036DE46B3
MANCVQCSAPAAIEDLDEQPPQAWCLGCATALVRAGDPVVNYRPFDDPDEYARVLAGGSTAVLPFG